MDIIPFAIELHILPIFKAGMEGSLGLNSNFLCKNPLTLLLQLVIFKVLVTPQHTSLPSLFALCLSYSPY